MSLALHTTVWNSFLDRLGSALADLLQSWHRPIGTSANLEALSDNLLLDIGIDPRSVASITGTVNTSPDLLYGQVTRLSSRVIAKS